MSNINNEQASEVEQLITIKDSQEVKEMILIFDKDGNQVAYAIYEKELFTTESYYNNRWHVFTAGRYQGTVINVPGIGDILGQPVEFSKALVRYMSK